jgi:anti-sigma-K factor RskA
MSDAREPEDDLTALRDLGRGLGGPETLEMPPPELWDRIAAATGTADTTSVDRAQDAGTDEPAVVSELPRRVPSSVWILGAAAAAVVVVAIGLALVSIGTEESVVASAQLERLQGDSAVGSAELRDVDGSLRLRVDASGIDPGDGFAEVWMIDPDVSQLVSLGPLRSDGTYDLPPGMDAEAFPIVDVSFEAFDGDPTHSGDSILRGQLEF